MNLENWQELWQGQQVPDHITHEAAIKEVGNRLQKVQRQTVFTALFLSVCFALVFIGMGWMWQQFSFESWWAKTGFVLLFLDMLGVLVLVWTRMVIYPRQSLLVNSREYVEKSIQKLRWQDRMTRTVIPCYLLLLVLGLSLIYVEVFAAAENWLKWVVHGSVLAFCVLVYLLSRPRYLRRYREHILPLIEEMESLLSSLN